MVARRLHQGWRGMQLVHQHMHPGCWETPPIPRRWTGTATLDALQPGRLSTSGQQPTQQHCACLTSSVVAPLLQAALHCAQVHGM